jgi:uncharacterized RDD family membrane protein YckC
MIIPTSSISPTPVPLTGPSLLRRLACFVYEAVLLFGVVMISGYLYSSLTQQRHALEGRHGLQAFVFLTFGIYFAWFWSHSGQTVAMRTWQIRIVKADGSPLTQPLALARYLLAYVWFLPGLAIGWWSGLQGSTALWPLVLNMILIVLLARFAPERQFLHDMLLGTRLIDVRPSTKVATLS